MTGQALEVMEQCQVIAGYMVYVDLVRGLFPHKEFLTTAMTREEERCRKAFDCCMEGKNTAMICSGDAGVYGMAGLILELAEQYPGVSVRTVPGITAACAGAAVLGAPLMHDFAVISLSDRLTPLEVIWNRVEAAARADFVICLYNQKSRKRKDYLEKAADIVMSFRDSETPVGIVRRAGRENSTYELTTLRELKNAEVDMFTIVIIGNSMTYVRDGRMITPRGYVLKEV